MAFPTVVKVSRPDGDGSGILIDDDLVVTAGHVLQSQAGPLDPEDYRVIVPGGAALAVKRVRWLDDWSRGRASADMGVLRLRAKRPDLVSPHAIDAQAMQLAVIVGGSGDQQYPGTVTRVASAGALDMLRSSDLAFPHGVSGGPVVRADGVVIGIATRSASTPEPDLLIGLPLLAATLGWLQHNCP
jgi:S1-C subfamily serine protease